MDNPNSNMSKTRCITILLRFYAGTAVACVYSIMVAYIVNYWEHDWERDLFVGFAVVLMQLPCTYVRSYPLYSYSGVVTGFTTVC